jgi:hypothetical protein
MTSAARATAGSLTMGARLDAGALLGDRIPQQMLELGGTQGLGGYGYKEFAGDRAVLARGFAAFPLGRVRTLDPGLRLNADAGWANGGPGLGELGLTSRASDGVRASIGAGISLFSEVAYVGVMRPLEGHRRLQLVVRYGNGF